MKVVCIVGGEGDNGRIYVIQILLLSLLQYPHTVTMSCIFDNVSSNVNILSQMMFADYLVGMFSCTNVSVPDNLGVTCSRIFTRMLDMICNILARTNRSHQLPTGFIISTSCYHVKQTC